MASIRTLIVDDEALARERVRTLLSEDTRFVLGGECEGGAAARQALAGQSFDLVFLDVQMPEVDGFDVLMSLDPDSLPAIVFVTAYEQYAIRAFEFHALDYLLKPFSKARFRQTLDHVAEALSRAAEQSGANNLKQLLGELRRPTVSDRLVIKSEGRILFLDWSEIDWVESAGNYIRLHTRDEMHLVRETTAAMEERLAGGPFVRIHRSVIVNLESIRALKPSPGGDFRVLLHSGAQLTLSRRYRGAFEERLGRTL